MLELIFSISPSMSIQGWFPLGLTGLISLPSRGLCPSYYVIELRLQHQSFHGYSGLVSHRADWFDLLAIPGTLKSLLQPQSSKASILCYSAFFTVQLSHPYKTTGYLSLGLTITEASQGDLLHSGCVYLEIRNPSLF